MLQSDSFFEINSHISEVYAELGLRALGFFVININDKTYGVKKWNATMLANSYDAVLERIKNRGNHRAMQELDKLSGFEIARAIEIIIWGYGSYGYGTHGDEKTLHSSLHLKQDEIEKNICDNNLLWAPDGDAAFDDGSRIIHFDVSDTEVRLVAYTVFGDDSLSLSTLSDVILDADFFYETLNSWATNFYKEWRARIG